MDFIYGAQNKTRTRLQILSKIACVFWTIFQRIITCVWLISRSATLCVSGSVRFTSPEVGIYYIHHLLISLLVSTQHLFCFQIENTVFIGFFLMCLFFAIVFVLVFLFLKGVFYLCGERERERGPYMRARACVNICFHY